MPGPVASIVPLTREHWRDVERIYRQGIDQGQATFEQSPPAPEDFYATRLPGYRFVAVDNSVVLGWIAITAVSARPVYAGVVEHSVYVAAEAQGRGIGRLLLEHLISSTEAAGLWTIQSSIFPENEASLRLHESAGFRRLGVRERIAKMTYGPMAGRWRDTVMMERRSSIAGVD